MLCLILTEGIHKKKVESVRKYANKIHRIPRQMQCSPHGQRCNKVVFITEEDDEGLPLMKVNVTGRENLWGKTKISLLRA